MSCPREPKDGTPLFTLHLAAVDNSPPHCLPPALHSFHSLRPRHPFPFLLPGEAKGAGSGCTLTCLDTTVCFCSVAKARGSTFPTLEMQVKSQRCDTGDVFIWERKEKVPLARSETHLTELLEGVCNSMSDYALYEDPVTKEKSYKRFAPRGNVGGNFPDFKNFKFDGPESSSALKFACESIVEDLEDNIISLFAREADHVAKKLCSEVSGHCKSSVFQHREL
ncbi:protein canopy-1-like isoform X1 [Xyrauchen texanus]|uniref:protein canopy-1-like isoform X1 n=1 Tax=Xyrauchen texanus TaxID=154827 RepID=UPI0022419E45|nr:protein canopy-1-like isoform X1 [Xyrauchen texanus]